MTGLNMNQLLQEAAGGTVETEPIVAVETEPIVESEGTETDPAPVPAPTPAPTPGVKPATKPAPTGQPKMNNPIKEVREKYNQEKSAREKMSTVMNKFTTGGYELNLTDFVEDGKLNYDSLSEAMEDVDITAKANVNNITPEIQAQIDRIEEDRVELNKQRLQVAMDRALANLQLDLGLKGSDISNFFADSLKLKKNPYTWLSQGGSLEDLHFLVYRERIMKEQIKGAVETAKETWTADANKQTKAPAYNPAQPRKDVPRSESGVSMSDLLSEAANKKFR